jgi:hypothetical protein
LHEDYLVRIAKETKTRRRAEEPQAPTLPEEPSLSLLVAEPTLSVVGEESSLAFLVAETTLSVVGEEPMRPHDLRELSDVVEHKYCQNQGTGIVDLVLRWIETMLAGHGYHQNRRAGVVCLVLAMELKAHVELLELSDVVKTLNVFLLIEKGYYQEGGGLGSLGWS